MLNLVVVLEFGSRNEFVLKVVKGDYEKIGNKIKDSRLEVDSEDLEFYSYWEFKDKYGVNKGRIVGCWEEESYMLFNLKDLVDIKELNEEMLNGWDSEVKLDWKEIIVEVEKLV